MQPNACNMENYMVANNFLCVYFIVMLLFMSRIEFSWFQPQNSFTSVLAESRPFFCQHAGRCLLHKTFHSHEFCIRELFSLIYNIVDNNPSTDSQPCDRFLFIVLFCKIQRNISQKLKMKLKP